MTHSPEVEIARLRRALEAIAEHPVVLERDPCDWHCTSTLVAIAKDTLNGADLYGVAAGGPRQEPT